MTALKTFANLWTLWDHPEAGAGEWSLAAKVTAVAAAGFDGVMGEPGGGLGALARGQGIAFAAFRRLDGRHDFHQALAKCRTEGAIVLQVHLGWHDTGAEEALELALRLDGAARAVGLEAVIETHRDTCTETPEKTAALERQFEQATGGRRLPLLLDFSHPAVVKHLDPPYALRLLADADLVRRTRWHHLRPFNGHHAQIPVLKPDGGLTEEMGDWLELARAIFGLLKSSGMPEVWVCPELGPVRGGYGLSCFPPSWQQAVALRELLVREWEAIQ
jgi:sugar phosphate isomerase/epimerase